MRRRFSSRPEFTKITQEQIIRAKEVNLIEYLQCNHYTLKKVGKVYQVMIGDSDSLTVFPDTNSWCWFSEVSNRGRPIGGTIIDFVMRFENKLFAEAVTELSEGNNFSPSGREVITRQNKPDKKEFHLPKRAETHRRAFAYLTQTRGIAPEIVQREMKRGSVYQSVFEKKNGSQVVGRFENVAFVGFCGEEAVYATQRGLTSMSNFKGDVENSDKRYSFLIQNQEADTVVVVESAIDALSYATLFPEERADILSCSGCSVLPLETYLLSHSQTKTIKIGTDNDEAGRKFGTKIKIQFSEKYRIIENYPKAKDYNEQLQMNKNPAPTKRKALRR